MRHVRVCLQDKEDDARVGLKSTALYLGDRTVPVLTAISALSTAGFCAAGPLRACVPSTPTAYLAPR